MNMKPGETAIGFIGIGVMGKSMAEHIRQAGYELHVYTRTAAKADELVHRGAVWHETPADLAAACDAIITMVGYPKDVEELYLGERGLIARAKAGAYLIDMTTSSPILAKRIHEAAARKGLYALDAPVSGGDIGARERRLSIMVGGDQEAFDAALPLLQRMRSGTAYEDVQPDRHRFEYARRLRSDRLCRSGGAGPEHRARQHRIRRRGQLVAQQSGTAHHRRQL
ncbi:MAG: oxidoreductase [Paenibacillus sp.]|nr:oxidoreductase [Paenibacillus sp.]